MSYDDWKTSEPERDPEIPLLCPKCKARFAADDVVKVVNADGDVEEYCPACGVEGLFDVPHCPYCGDATDGGHCSKGCYNADHSERG